MKAKSITKLFKSYLKIEKLKIDQNGVEVTRERIKTTDAVAAVVYDTKKQKYIFVKQYRPGPDDELIEIVAGKIDKDETPKDSIIREIKEELGYKVDTIYIIVPFHYVSPGYATERIQIYYAEVSEKISDGGGIEDEELEIIEMSKAELLMTDFTDGKTLSSVGGFMPTYFLFR